MENILEFLQKGGFIIYPLLLCSVAGLAIVIEKSLALRRKKVIVPEIVNVIDNIGDPAGQLTDFGLAKATGRNRRGADAQTARHER